MNNPKLARQIVAELPKLVSGNVIDDTAAAALRRHYEVQIKPGRSFATGLVITAILGGLLVGSGIILLLAHNWDELSRPARAIFAVLPLLASIALSGRTILRGMDSTAWREGCGVFWFLSIGASIALVSQTYHLYNDMAGFLFYWIVLALPVIYLLSSSAAFAGCMACLAAYALVLDNQPFSPKPLMLLALALPYYAWHVWKRRDALSVIWMSWALAVALPLMMTMIARKADAESNGVVYGLLSVVYYLAGCRWFGESRLFKNPFRTLGSLGIAIVAVSLTFIHKGAHAHASWLNVPPPAAIGWFAIIGALAWVTLGSDLLRHKTRFNIVASLLPLLLAFGVVFTEDGVLPLLASGYVLALGVFTLVKGIRRDSLFLMNEGMILITVLIVCRFFDSHYGFVARGVAFILVGCGFLAVNLLAIKRGQKQKGGAV